MDATKVKSKIKPKVIDETTRLEAAKYIARSMKPTSFLSYEDYFQEAWIALGSRIGKPFHSSVSYTTVDLMRVFFGRYKNENQRRRYILKHGIVDQSVDRDDDRKDVERKNSKFEREDPCDREGVIDSKDAYERMHRVMLAHCIEVGREAEFRALSEHDNPVDYLCRYRMCCEAQARVDLNKVKAMLSSRFNVKDFDHKVR